jgi:transcriptional regulator with XRE-family HTH domain
MGTVERAIDRGTRQGERWLRLLAGEFRTARLTSGLSQAQVAKAVRISKSAYGRIERGELKTLSFVVAARIAVVLALDLFVALYPGRRGLRDEPQARLIKLVVESIGPPLKYRTDMPLPRNGDAPEFRAWDLVATGHGERTTYGFESRLYDAQAQTRRHNLKRRDDPADHFVLVVADTHRNRRIMNEFPELFADLPRIPTADFLNTLKAGRHPPTGFLLLRARGLAGSTPTG